MFEKKKENQPLVVFLGGVLPECLHFELFGLGQFDWAVQRRGLGFPLQRLPIGDYGT